jgi:hypothetical protein
VFVLIISQNWTIQNVVEQVCLACGYPSIVARTLPEAETQLAQLGDEAVALIVIDTDVLGEGGADLQCEARRLLQAWAGQYPSLPVMCLGTVLQKYAILAVHFAPVPFVTLPFSSHGLMQTVQPLLREGSPLPPMASIQTRSPNRAPGGRPMHEPPLGASPPDGQ